MTWKERMIAAYHREEPDHVPVAPELWYLVPAKLTGKPFYEVGSPVGTIPLWEAQLNCARHYDVAAWLVPGPGRTRREPPDPSTYEVIEGGRILVRNEMDSKFGKLTSAAIYPPDDAGWPIERPVKEFRHYEAFRNFGQTDFTALDLSEIAECYEQCGGQGIVEVYVAGSFMDYVAGMRQGGMVQAIYDVLDNPGYFDEWFEWFVDHCVRGTEHMAQHAKADALFIGCGYASLEILGEKLWRKYDAPLFKAVCDAAHKHGKIVHLHQHGGCMRILRDIVEAGVDAVCPLERPPGGDVTDLAAVKREYGKDIALKGNVHTVETLIRGTVEDVIAQTRECLDAAKAGGGFILGTGDQVGHDTPEENLLAMIETGKRYG
jgi:uroporphyrinogen decarboxylase